VTVSGRPADIDLNLPRRNGLEVPQALRASDNLRAKLFSLIWGLSTGSRRDARGQTVEIPRERPR
jgi:hypothetical protein